MRRKYMDMQSILETYGEGAVNAIRAEMEVMAEKIVEDMKARVPVDSGALRDSIHWSWNKKKTAIRIVADAKNKKNGVPYARYVEFSPKINKPFFYPALDAHRDEYHEGIVRALKKAVEKGGGHGSG